MIMIFFMAAIPLAVAVSHFSREAAGAHAALMALAGAEEKTTALFKGWMETLSLGLYKGASSEQAMLDALRNEASRLEQLAANASFALAALSALVLAGHTVTWFRARSPEARRGFVRQLFAVAALYLGVGVTAPVLSVSAQTDFVFIGEVVLQHDTKDIIGTVEKLGTTGHLGLAALVALFSIVLPCAKLLLSWTALDAEHPNLRAGALGVVRAIGRWSMTDVFVVALLLAFFAAKAEQLTTAATGIGLWFFAAYALLSLAGGHLLEHSARGDSRV